MMDPFYMAITGATMLASRFVSSKLQSRFREFSATPVSMTGREVAEKMLADSGINDVEVMSVSGQLTDHYHPGRKTVNLSDVVYGEANVAAAAVAAHECGHAIQHAKAYSMLKLRSKLVPAVNISSKFLNIVLMAGLAIAATGNTFLLMIGVILFAVTTLFSVVTLPVEFDASNRALKWMESTGISAGETHGKAKKALFWAAMTYTVAALGSIGQLLYYVKIFLRAKNRNA